MSKNLFTGLLGLLLLTACASHTPRTSFQWDDRLQRGTLANGFEYWLLADPAAKGRVDMRLLVQAGSVDESPEQIGNAHLLEHMAFYQRGQLPGTVRQTLLGAGWKQGMNFNAVTSNDRTQYLLSPAAGNQQLELSLQVLATIAGPADFNAADLARERPIVLEEWRGGLGVAQRMNEQRRDAQRAGSRYVGHPPIGSQQGIENAQLESLKRFHQDWYQASNMRLIIVGDVDPKALAQRIEHWFGSLPATRSPARDYLDLPLDRQLKIIQLQDSQSGGSNVALMFRFQEPDTRGQDAAAARERLITRLTLSLVQQQLGRQARQEHSAVRSLTVQKHQIGQQSTVLAIGAGVSASGHEQGLQRLLEEVARLRQHGFNPQHLQEQKDSLRVVAQRMLDKGDDRDFADWVRRLNDASLQQHQVLRPSTIARNTLELLDSIQVEDLNQRFIRWTDQQDRILQYQAPGLTPVQLPTQEHVEASIQHWQQQDLAVALPIIKQNADLPTLSPAPNSGQVVATQRFDAEQVEHWQLSNGDRLVWLKRPGADGKAQLRIDSGAGYLAQGLIPWQAQAAAQLVGQSTPPGWSEAQLTRWRSTHGVQLSLDSQAQRLTFSGQSAVEQLPQLLGLYRSWQSQASISQEAVEDSLNSLADSLARQTDSINSRQGQALSELRFAPQPSITPTPEQLTQVSSEDLLEQWQRISRSPVTYYVMADLDAERLRTWVSQELAGIPRGPALSAPLTQALPGPRQQTLAIALEPRASLTSFSFSQHPWSPADAAGVSLLGKLLAEDLKAQLRGEASGVYKLSFETELSQDQQRIESRLAFTTDPRRQDELWQLARKVFAELPQRLDEQRIAPLRKAFESQEKLRRDDPQTQLHRLILSERAYADPRYLSQQQHLPQALQLPALKALAKVVWNPANLRQQRLLPAPEAQP